MHNSESPLYQQKINLELSGGECVFLEIKKSPGFPSCLLCSLPLLPAFLHSFGIWQQIDFECPHLRLKQVLCNSVCSNPAVSLQGCSEIVTEAPLESGEPHLLSMCVYSCVCVCPCRHTCKHAYTYQCSPCAALLISLQHFHCKTRRFAVTSNFNQQLSPFFNVCACRQPCPEVSGPFL